MLGIPCNKWANHDSARGTPNLKARIRGSNPPPPRSSFVDEDNYKKSLLPANVTPVRGSEAGAVRRDALRLYATKRSDQYPTAIRSPNPLTGVTPVLLNTRSL
ncbi:hypothetical protein PM082_002123 [Marasmius tenuissimus]|nr:hypothetical protein PM082_002123 [Marasmius tenuissimus]